MKMELFCHNTVSCDSYTCHSHNGVYYCHQYKFYTVKVIEGKLQGKKTPGRPRAILPGMLSPRGQFCGLGLGLGLVVMYLGLVASINFYVIH